MIGNKLCEPIFDRSLNFLQNSVLLIDKPSGITSNKAIQCVKRHIRADKIGHAGTLDMFASGLLVVCTGAATKFTGYYLDSDKIYRGTIKLGEQTDTLDPEGNVEKQKSFEHITEESVREVFDGFLGEHEQVPPLYSALKVSGRRASDIARSGGDVSLKARKIRIYSLNLLKADFCGGFLEIEIHCSKGTYIRSLARDISLALDTVGYLYRLRRYASGSFNLDCAINLDELLDTDPDEICDRGCCFSPVSGLTDFGIMTVSEKAQQRIVNGAYFNREDVIDFEQKSKKSFIICDMSKNIIAIADIDIEKWHIIYRNVFPKGILFYSK